jgi:hypothetical protein
VFAAFFLAVSLYNRLDFTITKDEAWQEQQAADKARGILQQLLAIWEGEWAGLWRVSWVFPGFRQCGRAVRACSAHGVSGWRLVEVLALADCCEQGTHPPHNSCCAPYVYQPSSAPLTTYLLLSVPLPLNPNNS